ncbi:CDP-glucose 4,6-dehydratase [Aureimonas sp. SA4125]|uniref:CDP-glucose 4,6-dehydratase n=1 Tax=Aureimonas sp. SA4125 TaxID=2826993 RepID=UPI001CC7DD65|nr:CDP-glucose 4,6-dehydratase [Aureimonas sp. SA4125]BDA82946.1 CDP-glucose 4,6-dehydratase [Aureimonas sp. SA4125]
MGEAALRKALSGRRVLVTGHTGFKGGWLALWLRRLGADVTGVSLAPETRSFCNAVRLEELVDGRRGDIRSAESFEAAIDGRNFDLVFHMAAQAIVRDCYRDPVGTYMTNVLGTAVVLQTARRMSGLKAVVVVTSDKCYENLEWTWGYREGDALGGHDPYSSSKACAELVAAAYRASFFNDPQGPQLATVRAGNVIGGGDWSTDRLLPDLIRAMEEGRPARLRNPRSVRPWQHVLEPLRGYLMLAAGLVEEGPRFTGAWNFGCDRDAAVDVVTLARLAAREMKGKGPGFVIENDGGPPESTLLRLDSTKAYVELGWKSVLSVKEAVTDTVAWHRTFAREPASIAEFSLRQIAAYVQRWEKVSALDFASPRTGTSPRSGTVPRTRAPSKTRVAACV